MTCGPRTLEAVRQDIDALDDQIHDLIVRRTALIEEVRAIKQGWQIKIQPSREAQIIHRLMRRHTGAFPRRELAAIWRLLITATLSFEGVFTVAVYLPRKDPGYWDAARDYFGAYVPITRHGSVRTVIEAVRRQEATVGVLPVPRPDDDDPWWRHLATTHADAPRIVARIPFAGFGNAIGGGLEALVVCPVDVKATGDDRSFVVVETTSSLGRGRLVAALEEAGFSPVATAAWGDVERPEIWLHLAEIEGFLAPDDARLAGIGQRVGKSFTRVLSIGGYAMPLANDVLGPPHGSRRPASKSVT